MKEDVYAALQAALLAANTDFCDFISIQDKLPSPRPAEEVLAALRNLKAEGRITFPDRGRNARSQYRFANPEASTPEASTPEAANPEVATPEAATPEAATPGKSGSIRVTIPDVSGLEPGEGYHGDAYLARIAAESTPCFGGWTPRASTCTRCSLRRECREAAIAELLTMQARYTAEVRSPVTPTPSETETPPTTLAPFSVVCVGCNGIIPSGNPVVARQDVGLLHPGCA